MSSGIGKYPILLKSNACFGHTAYVTREYCRTLTVRPLKRSFEHNFLSTVMEIETSHFVAWEPFCSKCHFWIIWVMYIVGIRRARSIFMQNCGSLLPFCEELLTGLFCSISKTTNVIRTRVFYVHFSQWELLMSWTNNHVTHSLPLFTGLENFSNWFWGQNASNGKYIHVLTYFIKQKSKYIYIEPELNIKIIKLKQKCGRMSEYCVLSPPFLLISSLNKSYWIPDNVRWTLKTIFYCHVETFAYKPSINSKIENSFCRSKLAIINIWENPNYIMVLTKKKKKLDQSVLSAFCMLWIPYFPIY